MGDKRPAPPLPLENKLLKTLSASVAASAGRRGDAPCRPSAGGAGVRPPRLENTLLARLSLRTPALSGGTSALPLRSSVLARYEAEHHPPPPEMLRPRAAAPPQMEYDGIENLRERSLVVRRGELERLAATSSDSEEEEDDDMGFGLFDVEPASMNMSIPGAFGSRSMPRSRSRPRALESRKKRRGVAFGGFGSNTFGFGGSWAEPEPQYDFKDVPLGSEFDDRPTWTSPEQTERPELEHARSAKVGWTEHWGGRVTLMRVEVEVLAERGTVMGWGFLAW